MKNIYLIVGCSGSGKTAITEKLEELYNLKSIQSRYDAYNEYFLIIKQKGNSV